MTREDPEEQLVTITPVPPPAPEPADRPWIGPLCIIGIPVALAIVVFVFFFQH